MHGFFVFLSALFIAMVLVASLMRWGHQLNLVDIPDERKVHRQIIPRTGGIGMVLGCVAAIFIWMDIGRDISLFLSGILVIACFGLWDDRMDLDYKLKFAGQLLAILIVVAPGCVVIERLSSWGEEALPDWVSLPLTVFFLLGMTNAMNLSDGLDGLAGGLSLLSLACAGVLAALGDADGLVLLAVAIIGATLGFLRYNTHPAQVFMGDTGSQFLGFGLGVLVIWLTQKGNTAVAPELPLLIVGLPIIDTLSVMASRIMRRRSPFKPDRKHFHHKLLDLGFDHYEAVLVIYVIQSMFVVSAYLMRYESAWVILGYYGTLFILIALFHPLAQAHGWRLRVFGSGHVSLVSKGVRKLYQNRWFARVSYFLVSYLIFGFMLVGTVLADQLPADVGYFAWLIVLVSLLFWLFRLPMAPWVQRLGIYAFAILVTYAAERSQTLLLGGGDDWLKYFFEGLAVLIGVGITYSARYHFSLTPSDFLVIFILLAVAYLPLFQQLNYARLAVEAAVLLYGVEFVLRRQGAPSLILWSGAMMGFALVGTRVLL
jgi:UDP-GlcNAc:undecaprenyl-phosphate GlcNAc-1-phosphate transferase